MDEKEADRIAELTDAVLGYERSVAERTATNLSLPLGGLGGTGTAR